MITLFLFACTWICTAKGVKLSGAMTYVLFAFILLTAIFHIDFVYLLPIAALYAIAAIYAAFIPWSKIESDTPRTNIKRWWKHPRELFGFRIINALFMFVPLPVLSWIGGAVLERVGPKIKRRRHLMEKNLNRILPDCANDKFMRQVWNNWGRTFVEGIKFSTYKTKMNKYITFRNKQMLHKYPQFLLTMPHFG